MFRFLARFGKLEFRSLWTRILAGFVDIDLIVYYFFLGPCQLRSAKVTGLSSSLPPHMELDG